MGVRMMCCVGAALLVMGCHNGAVSSSSTDSLLQRALVEFAMADAFSVPSGSVWPTPKLLPPDLAEYVKREYEHDPEVRSLIAHYFLRYNAQLLDRGLLTPGGGPGDLIRILWDKEADRNSRFIESPSMDEMQEHIRASEQWFLLAEDSRRLLAANNEKHRALMARMATPKGSP